MFSILVRKVADAYPPQTVAATDNLMRLRNLALFLDLAGAVTAFVLGALALHGLGGGLVTSLNAAPGGGWGVIVAGIAAIALYQLREKLVPFTPVQQDHLYASFGPDTDS